MTTHAPCTDRLAELVDATEGHVSLELAGHLRACEGCRGALYELQEGIEALRPEPAPEPGPWLATRIRARAEATRKRRRGALAVLAPATAMAAALVLTLHFTGSERSLAPPSQAVLAEMAKVVSRDDPVPSLPDTSAVDPDQLLAAEANLLDLDAASNTSVVDDALGASPLDPDLDDTLSGMSESDLQALLQALPG